MPSSASSIKGEKVVEDDVLSCDSEVEYLERGNCAARLRGLIFRVAISLLMIGACAGALVWSFETGEADVEDTHKKRDANVNFTINVNEWTPYPGTYSITYRQPDGKNENKLADPEVYESFWIQDFQHKKLVHMKDNQTRVYCFDKYAYWVRYDAKGNVAGCRYDYRMNYDVYISRLGLNNLQRDHSAFEATKHHSKVFIYNGDPSDVIIEGTPQDAFLVTAYADADDGALLGWDTYFTSSSNSSLVYLISYWYDSMVSLQEDIFPPAEDFNPPEQCQPTA